MKITAFAPVLLPGCALLLLAGCAGTALKARPTAAADSAKRLYDRLGGKEAITAVVEGFVARVAADKRINKYFWNADVPNLKAMLVEQICQATGGPCVYSGKDMKTAHAGMMIPDADFTALVEDLVFVLNSFKVGQTEQKELIGALGGMKGEVVNQ